MSERANEKGLPSRRNLSALNTGPRTAPVGSATLALGADEVLELRERILAYSDEVPSGCWEWNRYTQGDGYGYIRVKRRKIGAHRLSYVVFKDSIPPEMQVDHLCFNSRCVNPEHLRLLTLMENARHKLASYATHCQRGHEFTPENTRWQINYRNPSGPRQRACRACMAAYNRLRDQSRRKGAA